MSSPEESRSPIIVDGKRLVAVLSADGQELVSERDYQLDGPFIWVAAGVLVLLRDGARCLIRAATEAADLKSWVISDDLEQEPVKPLPPRNWPWTPELFNGCISQFLLGVATAPDLMARWQSLCPKGGCDPVAMKAFLARLDALDRAQTSK